jgi:hypothetical protein
MHFSSFIIVLYKIVTSLNKLINKSLFLNCDYQNYDTTYFAKTVIAVTATIISVPLSPNSSIFSPWHKSSPSTISILRLFFTGKTSLSFSSPTREE